MSGTRIRLPRYASLPEGVYFHQEVPADRRVVLQVPNEDRSDSETYIIDLDDMIHSAWMSGLSNSRNLLTTMGWARHVAYCPRTGYFTEMADLDDVPETTKRIAAARNEASVDFAADRMSVKLRRLRQSTPGPSRLRRALTGGGRRRRGVRR